MALQDVLKKITFTGFDGAGEQTLKGSLDELYTGSATARGTLDKIASAASNFVIQFLANNANVPLIGGEPDYRVRIDDGFASNYRFIDQTGTAVAVTTTRVLMHEIVHAVEKLRDNYNFFDNFAGDTVALTNTIMNEVGEASRRISYLGVAGESIMALGRNYSNGNPVDGAFVIRGALDMSVNRSGSSDVIFGASGWANTFKGGAGADYIYGRDGNDTITGGAGNDYIDGGDDDDVAVFGGDYEDYTISVDGGVHVVSDNRTGSPDGTDRVVNVEYARFADGTGVFTATGIVSPQNYVAGTDGANELIGNLNENIIDARGGDDTVRPAAGADIITLGAGADLLRGGLSDLNGDTVTDFGSDDMLVIENFTFNPSRGGVTVHATQAMFGYDADFDSAEDFQLTFEGDFSGGGFLASQQGADLYLSFETYLPGLAEGQRVATGAVNGINSSIFLTGDGTRSYDVTLKPANAGARMDNALGVYEIDGTGNIVDVRILFDTVKSPTTASARVTGVETGNQVGFFVIQDGADFAAALAETDTLDFVTATGARANVNSGQDALLSINGTRSGVTVFHSLDADMNPDNAVHALSGLLQDGSGITIGFEDLLGTGDADYQDVLFDVTVSDLLV